MSWMKSNSRAQKEILVDTGESPERENKMKESTKDQLKGKAHEVKGAAKEKAGQVTNNRELEAEGRHEKFGGKVQKKIGQVEKVLEK